MSYAGCYTLDLYCDNPDCDRKGFGPDQYTAETGATCRRNARQRGWLITADRQLCPACSGKKPKPKTTSRGSLGVDKIIEQAIKDGAESVPVREIFKRSKMKVGRE